MSTFRLSIRYLMSNIENTGEIELFNKHLFIEKCSVMEKLNVETNSYQL